jgi:hypothetical protein
VTNIPNNVFTDDDARAQQERALEIATIAARYLDDVYADHVAFFEKWGVSKYYGNRRPDYQTREGRIRALKRYGKPAHLADVQISTACITLAVEALRSGFMSAGLENVWQKLFAVLSRDNLFLGTDLQVLLQQLGWKLYYWNPDPTQNEKWDEEDRHLNPPGFGRKWNPVWGGHEARYRSVLASSTYSGKRVDNATSLVAFRTKPPAAFSRVPIFIGTAHDGYHVFPGRAGEVIEAHSVRSMNDRDNLQFSRFNPIASNGGPRWTHLERYRSGLIATPSSW